MSSNKTGGSTRGREEFLESLANGFALLRLFDCETPTLSIQLASQRLGITRAAARRILLTLERLGYLEGADGQFEPTPAVMQLGFTYFAAMRLPELAQPIVADIVRQTGETANLSVLHGNGVGQSPAI